MKVSEVVFREDLYPRLQTDHIAVQKYAEDLDVLPPIEVNQHNELIDGWHRWTAHKKKEAETIAAVVTETTGDAHLLELAIERNSTHGLQLSQEDKRNMARAIYGATPLSQQGEKKKKLAQILSVTERSVQTWLSRIDKDNKEARDAEVFALWLACHTQEEIAAAVGMTRTGIERALTQMETFRFASNPGELAEIDDDTARLDELERRNRGNADHVTDFAVPLYNVWKFQEKTGGISSHYGNTEQTILDNLLYLYTKPFDVVVDPFAGGGSTIDVCKKRFRRYWVSDRLPIVEREKDIRHWDVTQGVPPLHRWKDVRLVYLDPPYWKQAEGKYSKDTDDLANMSHEAFTTQLANLVNSTLAKLTDGYVALIIQPTQWKAESKEYTDHVLDVVKRVKARVDMRIQAPYESQQCTAQMVEWAKENKTVLVLSREIIVWRAS